MTRPDVLISGGDDNNADEPRQLPVWLRRGVPALVVVVLLTVLGVRLVHDQRSHDVALQAADAIDAVVRLNESGVGAGSSVVVGIQVSGRGASLRVDPPQVRSSDVVAVSVTGAPAVVDAGSGQQIRLRLQPDCAKEPSLAPLQVDVPVTPGSGKRRVLHVPFPEGPGLLRRACGFLPVDEALTMLLHSPVAISDGFTLQLMLRNDGRERITITSLQAPGLDSSVDLPAVVPPRGRSIELPLLVRLRVCADVPVGRTEVRVQAADASGRLAELVLPLDDEAARAYRALTRSCR